MSRWTDVVEPVRIYCHGKRSFALYSMSLQDWYCGRCGSKVKVVW